MCCAVVCCAVLCWHFEINLHHQPDTHPHRHCLVISAVAGPREPKLYMLIQALQDINCGQLLTRQGSVLPYLSGRFCRHLFRIIL